MVEEYERAVARGAKIYAEIVGYGANSDGHDMVAPSGEGAQRCMKIAHGSWPAVRKIDYLNPHGTSTPGRAIPRRWRPCVTSSATQMPLISSTKSLTGTFTGRGRSPRGDLLAC